MIVAHFSAGATSAMATKLAVDSGEQVEIIYADTGSEHEDNARFLADCEDRLFRQKVTVLRSSKYETIFDVFRARKFLSSPGGAPCTLEMKKLPIRDYLGTRIMTDTHVMGFDNSELKRAERFRSNNPEMPTWFPLIENRMSKQDCIDELLKLGIDVPMMYRLGYPNANCIGCVKAENISYWKAIQRDFPETFQWYAKFERSIGRKDSAGVPRGAAINKTERGGKRRRLFLDELDQVEDPGRGGMHKLSFSCGYSCGNQD